MDAASPRYYIRDGSHSFFSRGSWRGIRRGREVRVHRWFALHFNIVGVLIKSDGVTDLVDDSIPVVVVPAYVLALTAGAMKEMHGICCQTNPPDDVQVRRRSQ
jgi:hypothetical protein